LIYKILDSYSTFHTLQYSPYKPVAKIPEATGFHLQYLNFPESLQLATASWKSSYPTLTSYGIYHILTQLSSPADANKWSLKGWNSKSWIVPFWPVTFGYLDGRAQCFSSPSNTLVGIIVNADPPPPVLF